MLVYLVEDEPNIRAIEQCTLEHCQYNVRTMISAGELKEAISDEVPDLIVLDIMLPDNNDFEVVGNLRQNNRLRRTPIILVSARCTEMEKVEGLDAGADDYLTKPFGLMEFASRVNALLRRYGSDVKEHEEKSREFLRAGDIVMDTEKREVSCNKEPIFLTYKEFELLKYLIVNKGIVLSRDKIMEKVWGFDFQGESRTVDMHIKTIRAKLGKKSSIIKTVRNVGYKIEK